MSMTFGLVMAKPGTNDGFGVIAGSGGVELVNIVLSMKEEKRSC